MALLKKIALYSWALFTVSVVALTPDEIQRVRIIVGQSCSAAGIPASSASLIEFLVNNIALGGQGSSTISSADFLSRMYDLEASFVYGDMLFGHQAPSTKELLSGVMASISKQAREECSAKGKLTVQQIVEYRLNLLKCAAESAACIPAFRAKILRGASSFEALSREQLCANVQRNLSTLIEHPTYPKFEVQVKVTSLALLLACERGDLVVEVAQ